MGLASAQFSRGTREDYYLASRGVAPWLVGLSAVATNNSGYMFIGLMGYTYRSGLSSIWLMLGWIVGDFIASLFVHRKLREAAASAGSTSFVGALAHWHSDSERFRTLQRIAALISLVFLLTYASAQLVAGSKALHTLLGWPLWGGAVMGAVLVGVYCFSGGIRASIWTDAAQSFVMIIAMLALLLSALQSFGGVDGALVRLHSVDGYMDWFPRDLALPGIAGAILFALSWLFAGFSVIGQPHIMIRFMALDQPQSMTAVRWWYYLWFILFYSMATAVGMLSRIYLAPGAFDVELALPTMAAGLLPGFWVGIVLAGIFAATMSTADSLILSASAALTHDLLPHKAEATWVLKTATIAATVCALGLALSSSQSVFDLVVFAWSGMASAFGPLLLVYTLGARPSQVQATAMMIVGLAVAVLWRHLGWQSAVYEGMPGILAGLLVFVAFGLRSIRARLSSARATQ
ncbi:MAG TPA: sodium/proline symporter [Spongiibacteraceae bacterium]|nr:sodium/proline symporter [Spongiibacteraceae bacterium]